MTRYGHANAISPKDLAAMHPALVGAGERAAAGLPPANANANAPTAMAGQPSSAASPPQNMLLGNLGQTDAAPAPSMNMLFGTAAQPQMPPPPPASPPPPTAMPSPSQPAALPGQAASTAIGRATGADKMTDADLAKGFARVSYIRDGIANMMRQGSTPTHDDVLDAVAKGVKDGIFPAAEAGQIMGGLTSDPAKLPAELDQRHKVALHQMVHLAGEIQKRGAAANPQGDA